MASNLSKLAHQIKALQERESVLVAEEAADQAARHALDNEYHRASQRFDDEAKRRTNELDQLRGTRLIEAPKPDALALPKTEEMEVDCSTPPPIKIEDSDVASEAASSHSRSPSTEANLMTPDSPSLMSKDRQRVKMHVDRIDNTDAGVRAKPPCDRCDKRGLVSTCRVYTPEARAEHYRPGTGWKCSNCLTAPGPCSFQRASGGYQTKSTS